MFSMFPFPSSKTGCTATFVAYPAPVCMPGILQRPLCSPGDAAESLLMDLLSHLHYNCFLRDLPLDSSLLPGLENSFINKVFYRLQWRTFLADFLLYIPHLHVHGEGFPMLPWGWILGQVSRISGSSSAGGERDGRGSCGYPYTAQ